MLKLVVEACGGRLLFYFFVSYLWELQKWNNPRNWLNTENRVDEKSADSFWKEKKFICSLFEVMALFSPEELLSEAVKSCLFTKPLFQNW